MGECRGGGDGGGRRWYEPTIEFEFKSSGNQPLESKHTPRSKGGRGTLETNLPSILPTCTEGTQTTTFVHPTTTATITTTTRDPHWYDSCRRGYFTPRSVRIRDILALFYPLPTTITTRYNYLCRYHSGCQRYGPRSISILLPRRIRTPHAGIA